MTGLIRRLGGFIDQQIARRAPAQDLPISVSPRRLYILPTRAAALLATAVLVMGLAATNYGNNLAFAATFWLVAVILVSMHRAHRNLAGVELRATGRGGLCRGDLRLHLACRTARPRRRITIRAEGSPGACLDIETDSPLTLSLTAQARRCHSLPALTLASRYPLGLFRCRARLTVKGTITVYPSPMGRALSDAVETQAAGDSVAARGAGDEFIGHRRYQHGDMARDIDWKQSARTPYWLVRDRAGLHEPATTELVFEALTDLTYEARLSQLTGWILDAEAADRAYTLVLPSVRLGPLRGPAHRAACLAALVDMP